MLATNIVQTCLRCGFQWVNDRRYVRKFCNECWDSGRSQAKTGISADNLLKVLRHVELRLVTAQAVHLLKMGRPREALLVLETHPGNADVWMR